MLSGQSDLKTVLDAINNGEVYKFILKPWNQEEFHQTILHTLDHFRLVDENKELHEKQEFQERQILQLSRLVDKNQSQL